MPVWHAAARKWVQDGRLALLGVVQEQHAERARLFAQWQGLEWPLLHDPINALELSAVPVLVALDEHGIVRAVGPKVETFEADFLNRDFPDDAGPAARALRRPPDLGALRRATATAGTGDAWRRLGDALALWGGPKRLDEAMDAYERAVKAAPGDGNALFRLGVCHRLRYDSGAGQPSDFQAAADLWGRALETDPNRYIWRRRIQQYGPRLDKPYPFYDWVAQAQAEVTARGEKPVALPVPPYGAEIAAPAKEVSPAAKAETAPDPQGRVARDTGGLVRVEVAAVPSRVRPGQATRLHVVLRPGGSAHWNNEAEPLRLWLEAPPGWRLSQQLLSAPQPRDPETTEVRRLDVEAQAPPDAPAGRVRLRGYALYYVCEKANGACRFLRQDVEWVVEVTR